MSDVHEYICELLGRKMLPRSPIGKNVDTKVNVDVNSI